MPDTQTATPMQWEQWCGLPAAQAGGGNAPPPKMLSLEIELGRTQIERGEAQELRPGSVIPLDRSAGDPVDLYAGGRRIGRGEVLELGGTLAVRVVELASERPA
jgi:flagellar motor switch protein FliN